MVCMTNIINIPVNIGKYIYVPRKYYKDTYKIEKYSVTGISWKENKTFQHKDLGWAVIANGTRYRFQNQNKSWFTSYKEVEEHIKNKGLVIVT